MANLDIVNPDSKKAGTAAMPEQFDEEIRPDIIRRAFHYYMSISRQPYGASPEAGKRPSVRVSKRRRDYRGCYGIGISRVPRKVHSRRGRRMNWTGAFAPGTVGGRRAHPPKAEKQFAHKLNIKERRKSIRSALAATLQKGLVGRTHRVPENYPVVLAESFEALSRTTDVKEGLLKLGLSEELGRASARKVRAGKGKTRGRKYATRKGPLLVVSGDCKLLRSAGNLAGVDVVRVNELNVLHLAPGAEPGRLAYFTKPALELMKGEGLFMPPKRRTIAVRQEGQKVMEQNWPMPAGEPVKKAPAKKKVPVKKKAPVKREAPAKGK